MSNDETNPIPELTATHVPVELTNVVMPRLISLCAITRNPGATATEILADVPALVESVHGSIARTVGRPHATVANMTQAQHAAWLIASLRKLADYVEGK